MPTSAIKQFLVVYDIRRRAADVTELGTDRSSAMHAYEAAEKRFAGDADIEVVMLGSDSLETVRRTHSSYFGGPDSSPASGDHSHATAGAR